MQSAERRVRGLTLNASDLGFQSVLCSMKIRRCSSFVNASLSGARIAIAETASVASARAPKRSKYAVSSSLKDSDYSGVRAVEAASTS